MKKILTKSAIGIVLVLMFAGWGGTGHKIINGNVTTCFPTSMNFPNTWGPFLIAHASDADNRKQTDPTESTRHFIDIDAYPEFVANDSINTDYNAFVAQHGSNTVITNGILPWAIIRWEDSLKHAFQQRNWTLAMQLSADIGHYVGDGHQPLHCTKNYDGQFTNQSGVHSRYESTLVGKYQSSIVYNNDTASYVSNVSAYTFKFIYLSNKYVDSTLYGDSVAAAFAGNTKDTVYLRKYWELCGNQIIYMMKTASRSVADLIYTAWIDAGSPDPNLTSIKELKTSPASFSLYQNYPNPFNPSTSIQFSVPQKGNVSLNVYDINGKKVAELLNGNKEAGNYEVNFDASKLSSGVYFYELQASGFFQAKKMILMK